MTVLKRSRRQQQPSKEARKAPSVAPLPEYAERALLTLTAKMQECVERLDIMDQRIDELYETAMNAPSHGDVMEVRMHSAKLAAELARATVELRGEIGMASDEARKAARVSRPAVEEPPMALPVDLSDEDEDRKGWSATA